MVGDWRFSGYFKSNFVKYLNHIMCVVVLFIITPMKARGEMSQCTEWQYDTTEFKDTAVTENDWVCDKVKTQGLQF